MVALDMSEADHYLINYSNLFSQIFKTKVIYFVHIIPDMTKPKNISAEFQKLFSPEYPIDEKIRNKLELDIQEIIGEQNKFEWTVEVLEGTPYGKLIHWLDVKVVDLLVVGHKKRTEGSGITTRKVTRKSKINVLFVPDKTFEILTNIVVPIDFSVNSYRALYNALEIKKSFPEVNVKALHIVSHPPLDYYAGSLSSEALWVALEEEAKLKFQKFTDKYDLPDSKIQPVFINDTTNGISKGLVKYLNENHTDLVIMGAKGHSPFETFLYGSVTETFIETYHNSPVLVVR